MGAIDLLWHVVNLFVVPLALGLVASAAIKVVWRNRLRSVPFIRLAGPGCLAACVGEVVGLVALGQDGRMAGYAATVVATSLALWWTAFVRPAA